ncbi:hypothetical protein BDP55DRAFT_402826 [Colletotrichum godetiae]|uniref:Uncharacterized protein n=1 Tax=Colletotrichum godetiae TaxID=1209918 RepID=A0AAJ0A803_9PEZI|nr:uncharacterized protein BDP55DRAFT_402826 [Colletotrichum godetiae]KAK1658224.1 hypothetical protein BDP55DRAFT_402826 [Colletotrichum godetiae]
MSAVLRALIIEPRQFQRFPSRNFKSFQRLLVSYALRKFEESCQTMAHLGIKRSKDRPSSGPKKVKTYDGANVGKQNAPDTKLLKGQSEGSRRDDRRKSDAIPAITSLSKRTAGGKIPHHCLRDKHKYHKGCVKAGCMVKCDECIWYVSTEKGNNGSECRNCRNNERRQKQIEDRERGASAIANRVLATRQPARVTKSTTRLRKESLRRSSQIVWAKRLGKVISVAIPEDVPETTDSDTSMDECLVSDVVESNTAVSDADQESVPACVEPITDVKEKLGFNPEKPGPLSLEELRLRRIREAEEILKLVREGLDRLI